MRIRRQHGQSMTEYLVVLGVTGAALLATTTDVNQIFNTIRDSYENQSREMSKVQAYNNPKIRFNNNDPITEGPGVSEPPGQYPPEDEIPDTLAHIPLVYDDQGNQVGYLQGDKLIGTDGVYLGTCIQNNSNLTPLPATPGNVQSGGIDFEAPPELPPAEDPDCTFVDAAGNPIFPGASTSWGFQDKNGKPVPLMALVKNGKVVGFGYSTDGKLYNSVGQRITNTDGLQAQPAQEVIEINSDGKAYTFGYSHNGIVYSVQDALNEKQNKLYENSLSGNPVEYVGVSFNLSDLPLSVQNNWNGYQPCLVMPRGWNGIIGNGNALTGTWENKMNNPSIVISSAGGLLNTQGYRGFVRLPVSSCNSQSRVEYDPAQNKWIMKK